MVNFTDPILENPTRQRGASRMSVSRMAPSRLEADKSQLDFEFGKTAQCIVNIVNLVPYVAFCVIYNYLS